MALVPIKNRPGQFFQVDEEDLERVNRKSWWMSDGGYLYSSFSGQHILLHRFIMGITDPSIKVDHKWRDKADNRKSELRVATVAQNAWNRKANSRSSTGYRGVAPCKVTGKWEALIMANGVRHNLGKYRTPEEAARAWDKKAIELYGEFARLNFPDFDYSNYEPENITHKNTSKYPGVNWDRTHSDWVGMVYFNKGRYGCGRHETERGAALAVLEMMKMVCPFRLEMKRYKPLKELEEAI